MENFRHVLVCLSGGPDSTYLVTYLSEKYPHLTLTCVYFNHHLRSKHAIQTDLKSVQRIAAQYGLNVIQKAIPVAFASQKWKTTLETAGRLLRYHCAWRIAQRLNCQAIVTGHHQDDHIETVVMKNERGAHFGWEGISEYSVLKDGLYLWRPLRHHTKSDILDALQKNGTFYSEDHTNQDTRFTRNAIRSALAKGEVFCNTDHAEHQQKIFQEQYNDRSFYEQLVYSHAGIEVDEKWFKTSETQALNRLYSIFSFLNHKAYLDLFETPRAVQTDLSASSYKDVLKHIHSHSTATKNMGKTITINRVDHTIVFLYQQKNRKGPQKKRISKLPETVVLESGMRLHFEWTPSHPKSFKEENCAYLCWDGPPDVPMYLRTRQTADYFHPMGRHHAIRLSKYLIAKKIPRIFRNQIPLFFINNTLAWGLYVGVSDLFKVTSHTRNIIKITIEV